MTSTADCREIRQSLGVYVLGAIDPAERARVDEHLATCLDCREELAAMAGLPAMLRKIPLAEAERIAAVGPGGDSAAPEELLHSLLARTAAVRRVRRWRSLAAAAAVVLAALGGGVAVAHALQPGSGHVAIQQHWHSKTVTDAATGATMTVKFRQLQNGSGTQLMIGVSGIKQGTVCQFKVIDAAGQRWTVETWRVNYRVGPPAWFPAATSIAGKDLRGFELTSGGRLLATAPVA